VTKASFWVSVAQLVVAILALAVSVAALHQQAPVCPPPSTHHHRMHHRPPRGGLKGFHGRRLSLQHRHPSGDCYVR
jgi:hypothetical protein